MFVNGRLNSAMPGWNRKFLFKKQKLSKNDLDYVFIITFLNSRLESKYNLYVIFKGHLD
jgi:hypothetical protein